MGAEQRSGFVVWHRRVFDSWVWSLPAAQFKVVFAIVGFANWQAGQWHDGVAPVDIPRGEFITSQAKLAKECKVSTKIVRSTLVKLERAKMIAIVAGRASNYTRIRVINYGSYQDVPEPEGERRASGGRAEGERRATSEQGNKGTSKQTTNVDAKPSTGSSQVGLFPGSGPAPEAPANGTGASSVTKRVLVYLNKKRNGAESSTLGWQPYLKLVKRALGAGHTEKELKLVVWWAAEHEWPLSDPDHAKRVHPSTLFPISKSSGYRALPQYLDLAREKFRDVNRREFNPHPTPEQHHA